LGAWEAEGRLDAHRRLAFCSCVLRQPPPAIRGGKRHRSQNWSRVGDSVWTPAFAGVTKRSRYSSQAGLKPARAGIQSLKHGGRGGGLAQESLSPEEGSLLTASRGFWRGMGPRIKSGASPARAGQSDPLDRGHGMLDVGCREWGTGNTVSKSALGLFYIVFQNTYLPHPTPYLLPSRICGLPRLVAEGDPEACPELDSRSTLSEKSRFGCCRRSGDGHLNRKLNRGLMTRHGPRLAVATLPWPGTRNAGYEM